LKARIEHLEAERARGAIEIVRLRQDGGAAVAVVRDGRVVNRQEVTAEEAARLARGAIVIARTYGER
jgi:hypothetical protein